MNTAGSSRVGRADTYITGQVSGGVVVQVHPRLRAVGGADTAVPCISLQVQEIDKFRLNFVILSYVMSCLSYLKIN